MTTPLPQIVCPGCRTVNEADTNFCGRCGTDLRALSGRAVTLPSPAGASAARRPSASGATVDPWMGRVIDGRYRVLARLGQGGMGVVYKVEHQRMGKIAAMKVLHRELAGDKEVVKRFRREAEAVSKLTHPNTVQTFDFGTSDGAMYLVMEYVRGEDLGTILRRDGPLPFRRSVPIFVQICGALAEAHELGIVHRDLKPENILVTRTRDGHDHVKVLDFGLAKLAEREEAAEVTGRGSIVGTPYYMSPEQIRGEVLDHRSDIYSLGALMYRIVTGEHPFGAQSPVGVLTKHLTDELVSPRMRRPDLEIDPRLEAVILRAMAKRRETRYATVDSLREELERAWDETHPTGRLESGRLGVATPVGGSGALPPAAPSVGPTHTPVSLTAFKGPERRGADEHQGSAEGRLRREDFDAFERALRRRQRLRLLSVPLVALALAAAVVGWIRWQKRQPRAIESEPNDDLDAPTLIAVGKPVRGKIGKRLDTDKGDRDYYKVVLPRQGDGPSRLSVRLSGIGNLDLAFLVVNAGRTQLAFVDNLGVGEGELLPNLAVVDELVYVAVFESPKRADGRGPTENITDEYELRVDVAPFAADEEREPNDLESEATRLAPGVKMRGTLGRYRDVDRFALDGPAGRYEVLLVAPQGVPAVLRVNDVTTDGSARAELAPGAIVAVERRDPDAKPGERPLADRVELEYTLELRPAR